jgi:aminopeptidase C
MDEKLQKDLKKFLDRILNLNMDDFYNLYKDEDKKYDTNDDTPNYLAKQAIDLLKRLD